MKRPWPEPFEDCYSVCKTTGCWLWDRALKGCGYGHKMYQGKLQGAHRISWQIHRGPIPDGLWVLHKCDVMRCVNPDHLFLGTHQDNVDDKHRKGRDLLESCKYGHPLTEGNLYFNSNGRRRCKACTRRRGAEYDARKKKEVSHAI